MKPNLHDLYKSHKGKISDKWALYIDEFDNLFLRFREAEISLFEIGVQNGGSLEIWAKYFSKARHIIGCDIDEICRDLEFSDPRISIIIGDVNNDEVEDHLNKSVSGLDIVIDDGSHNSSDIIKSFSRYLKYVNIDGFYIIEDLHTSYWDEYEGGLYNPYSAISFLKRLVDLTNYEHWTYDHRRSEYLEPFINTFNLNLQDEDLSKIHSVEFINSLCIIHIKPDKQNLLGNRMVVGNDGLVFPEIKESEGKQAPKKPQTNNNFDNLDVFSLIKENKELQSEVERVLSENQQLKNEIDHSNKILAKTITEDNIQRRILEEEVNNHEKLIKQIRDNLKNQEIQINQLSDEIIKKEKIIAQLNNYVHKRDQIIGKINVELSERKTFIEQLRTDLNRKESEISQLNKDIKQREQKTHQINSDLVNKIELISDLNKKIDQQSKDIEFYKAHIFTLQQEILSYTTSTSWRFTRPLRKISNIFKGNKNA